MRYLPSPYRPGIIDEARKIITRIRRRDIRRKKPTPEEQIDFVVVRKIQKKHPADGITDMELSNAKEPLMDEKGRPTIDKDGLPTHRQRRKTKREITFFNDSGKYGMDIVGRPIGWIIGKRKGIAFFYTIAEGKTATYTKQKCKAPKEGWESKEKRLEYAERNPGIIRRRAQKLEQEIMNGVY